MLRVGGNELLDQQVISTISGAETYLLVNLSTRYPVNREFRQRVFNYMFIPPST